jgi:hypothetical protein
MPSNFRENKEENKIILRPSSPTTTNNMEREWVGGTKGGIEDSLPTLTVSIVSCPGCFLGKVNLITYI